jgi:metal-sulfur cluster biosynthetic enzyme
MPSVDTATVVAALCTVLDPEVGVNIVDLGLVYGIDVKDQRVRLSLTMTSSACPLSAYLEDAIERAIRARIPEVAAVEVAMVWQPAWDAAMMSPEAKRQLGWMSS